MKETKEEKIQNNRIVRDLKEADEKKVEYYRHRALVPRTEERRILMGIHQNIVNGPRTATGRQPPRPPPQLIWKKTRIERRCTGGIDWARYLEKILYPKLYPFLQQIQREY